MPWCSVALQSAQHCCSLAYLPLRLSSHPLIERGYSMVETASRKIVHDSAQLKRDEEVRLTFAKGWAKAQVKDKG